MGFDKNKGSKQYTFESLGRKGKVIHLVNPARCAEDNEFPSYQLPNKIVHCLLIILNS